jgi:hypothetical protein
MVRIPPLVTALFILCWESRAFTILLEPREAPLRSCDDRGTPRVRIRIVLQTLQQGIRVLFASGMKLNFVLPCNDECATSNTAEGIENATRQQWLNKEDS